MDLRAVELDAVADTQVIDALEVEIAHAAVVEAHLNAVDLVVAASASLDRVAGDRPTDGASAGGDRTAGAGLLPAGRSRAGLC